MIYLYIFLSAVILLLLYMRFEARSLEVNRIPFSKGIKSLKIAHLSDIHINRLKVPLPDIIKAIDREQPDIIIITGDYIEKPCHAEAFLSFLDQIKKNYTILLCLGNHDYKAFRNDKKELENFINSIKYRGITVLHNNSICFEKNSRKYNIIGLEDLRMGKPDIDRAICKSCKDQYTNIAISHNPDVVFKIPKGSVDYLFCGHFHGGQIWAPFNLEFKILRKDKLCRMGIKEGLHRINGITLYINKGLGNVVVPLRFLSRPEISVYYI
jgi:predicted MPP superfamily phosphohydrolase